MLNVCSLGTIDYMEAYNLQLQLVEKRVQGEIQDTLLLLEHPPVYTFGVSGKEEHLLVDREWLKDHGYSTYKIGRGGDITYHGPGQVVGYPIFDLKDHGKDTHEFLRRMEKSVISALSDFGIKGRSVEDFTGVWVEEEKICAIGIGVKRWVSFHGFALNNSPDLSDFKKIIPCGIVDKEVTSIKKILREEQPMDKVIQSLAQAYADEFHDGQYQMIELEAIA